MREDLLNAVSNLVHRHVLRELHDMTGALLAQLDAGDVAISFNERDRPAPVKLPRASTIARKERRRRAQQRQAAATATTGAAASVTAAPADPWPALRTEFHGAIKARHLTRSKVAADLAVSKGSVCGWLVPHGAPPSAGNIDKVRGWLASAPETMPETPAVLDDWPRVREQLQAVIRDRGLTHAQIGTALDVQRATIGAWLAKSHGDRAPGLRVLGRIRVWLREGATLPATETDSPPHHLSAAEMARLSGHLSLDNAHELRERFGANRELLEKAAAGEHLAGDVIARLRSVLLGNGAAG